MQGYDYNNLNRGKFFPNAFYDKLSQEANYNCQGSSCTCKYTQRRSNYDRIQSQLYEDKNYTIDLNNFKILKPNYYNSKKYTGV